MASSASTTSLHSDKTVRSRLADFTAWQRAIIEVLLTPRELPYRELNQKVASLPTPPTQLQFDNAINELIRQGYLMSFIEDGDVYYLLEIDLKGEKRDEKTHGGSRPDLLLDNLKE